MKRGMMVLLALCVGLLTGCLPAEPPVKGEPDIMKKVRIKRGIPKPLPGHPGNIFLQREEVCVKAPEAPGAVGWLCMDYERKTVSKGAEPTARLGTLPVGYYEVWATDRAGKPLRKTTLGVLQPLRAPTPDDSPICLDAASAWLNNKRYGLPPNIREAASQAALAGVNWVRDRLAWAGTEPEKGKFAERTFYDETARIQSEAGLKVLQVFHSSPKWANPDATVRFPCDLRDAYNYVKTMSARWRGQVRAWEPWNEADIPAFGGHTGAEIATYQKAAYWGIRHGNPDAIVCQNVFASGPEAILVNFDENEPWAYFDTFNFHHYAQIKALPDRYACMRRVSGGRPFWISEAAVTVQWEGDEKEQEPTWESQQRQARNVVEVYAAGIHEGACALFYFILAHYVEARTQYGLTHKDLTPRPGYVALAAAGRLLAGAKPLGRFKTDGASSLHAFAFRAAPDGERRIVVVAWAEEGKVLVPIPPDVNPLSAFDVLGRTIKDPNSAMEAGTDPVYLLLDCRSERRLPLTPPPAPAPWKEAAACPVVIQALIPQERVRLNSSAYELLLDEAMEIPLYVYNFADQPVITRIAATAEGRVRVELSEASVPLEPLGRTPLSVRVSWPRPPADLLSVPVRFVADCGAKGRAVTVIRLVCPRGEVPPRKSLPLASAASTANWRRCVSPGKMTIEPAEGGGVLIDAAMQPGDRWAYPILCPSPDDLPKEDWDGLAFTIIPQVGQADFKAIFDKANGSSYIAGADIGQRLQMGRAYRVVVFFRECAWGGFSKPDPDNKLGLDQIRTMKLGCNTKEEHVRFILRDVAWVKYAP